MAKKTPIGKIDKQLPHPSEPLVNERHEAFCRNVAAGANQTDAYHAAHKCERKTAAANGSALARHNPLVKQRLSFLNADKDMTGLRVVNLKQKRDLLAKMMLESTDDRIVMKAIALDARIAGEFAPAQTENLSVNIQGGASTGGEFQRRLAAVRQQRDRQVDRPADTG